MRLPPLFTTDPLTIYLNDHLAGATVGRELAVRTLSANRGTEFEAPLAQLAGEIEEDRAEVERIMGRLGVPKDRAKVAAGWLAEKLGRLKVNGQLTGYAPLSRVLELEGLAGGVEAKLSLWRALRDARGHDPRLAEHDLDGLVARAEGQLETIAGLQSRAARAAL